MAIGDDISIDLTNKIVKRSSGAGVTVYTARALYSELQDQFDELDHLDDLVPMSAQTPTSYTMINGWYLQEELTQFIDGGAIQTDGYTGEIRTLICGSPSWVNFASTDIGKTLTGGTTSDTGIVLDYDNAVKKIWVRMVDSGDTFDDAAETYACGGTGSALSTAISTTGETIFANLYTLGTLEGTPTLYVFQDGERANPDWWDTGHIDILIKVSETGVDINSKKVTVFCRNWTDLYDHFEITLTTAGQNAVPLGTSDDLNNTNTEAAVEDWQDGTEAYTIGIAFSFAAPYSYDIGDGNGAQDYEVQIDCDSQSLSKVYEVCKFWCRTGSTKQLETNADDQFVDGEEYDSADTGVYANVKSSPIGTFAGGVFFGARSVYFTNLHADDAQAFQLIDKAGITRYPPNYQSFSVAGVVSGDRVAVYPDTGAGNGVVNKTQYTSHNTNNVAGDSTIEMTGSIPTDTPTSGTIIVVAADENEEHTYRYDSVSGAIATFPTAAVGSGTAGSTTTQLTDSTAAFTTTDDIEVGDIIYDSTNSEYAYVVSIDSATQLTMTSKTTTWNAANYEANSLVQTYNNSDTAYIPYLYAEATGTNVTDTTTIYTTDKYVLVVVRKKGILPFTSTGTYSSTGYSATAIRTTDSIVQ